MVDTLFALGLSVSYNRVIEIVTALGNNVTQYYQKIDAVCPPQLKVGNFITAAADNIDHNTSSSTSTSSFHGTSLSLFQNYSNDTHDNHEGDQSNDHGFTHSISLSQNDGRLDLTDLPLYYRNIRPTNLPIGDIVVPRMTGNITSSCNSLEVEMEKEYAWLDQVEKKRKDNVSSESDL